METKDNASVSVWVCVQNSGCPVGFPVKQPEKVYPKHTHTCTTHPFASEPGPIRPSGAAKVVDACRFKGLHLCRQGGFKLAKAVGLRFS